MKSLSTFLSALLFLLACAVGWLVLPLLLIVSGTALLAYAILVEIAVSMIGSRTAAPDCYAARKMADRLCGGSGHSGADPRSS